MQTTTRIATKKLAFYKEQGSWFSDLPEFLEQGLGSKANLLMVDGSDEFLDILSNNGINAVVEAADQAFEDFTTVLEKINVGLDRDLLNKIGHAPVDYGAYYQVTIHHNQPFSHTLWLCPVAEYVFGGSYPDYIYLKQLV